MAPTSILFSLRDTYQPQNSFRFVIPTNPKGFHFASRYQPATSNDRTELSQKSCPLFFTIIIITYMLQCRCLVRFVFCLVRPFHCRQDDNKLDKSLRHMPTPPQSEFPVAILALVSQAEVRVLHSSYSTDGRCKGHHRFRRPCEQGPEKQRFRKDAKTWQARCSSDCAAPLVQHTAECQS